MASKLNIHTFTNPRAPATGRVIRLLVWPFLFSLAILTPSVCAELPKYYGEKFARKGHGWSDVRPREQIARPPFDSSKPDRAYLEQLEAFESSTGPYADTLAEPLLGLGQYHSRRGEYKQAVKLYQRALHIVRLNDGLYSELQTPIVRELLDTIRASGDLNALDDRYDYFFRLYGRGQPPYTAIRMRAALEYLRWQREALRLEVDTSGQRRLLNLYDLNEDLLESAQASISSNLEDQWQLTLGQIRNLYLLQSRVTPPIESTSLVTRSSIQSTQGQDAEFDFTQRQLENRRRNAFRSGKTILDKFIMAIETKEATAGLSATELEQKARAILELADWYQWNASYSRASENYARVAGILSDAGRGELLQDWFGAPVELPDNGAFWQPPDLKQPFVVVANFDVSARGRVRNLSVELANADEPHNLYRFKRGLAGTRFRPRFKNGEAVATENLSREYEVYK